jgi:hypothetical protein
MRNFNNLNKEISVIAKSFAITTVVILALSAGNLNAQWENIPGKAVDIAAAGDSIFAVWSIGESGAVFKWSEDSFSWENYGGNASQIAVESNGTPWVVNNQQVYRLRGRTWQNMPGKLIAVGAGGGTVWGIGDSGAVFKWNEDSFSWENFGGKATRITVTNDGTPWVINNEQIYRLRGRTWQNMPGKATEIGAGGNEVWAVGQSEAVFRWSENAFAWMNHAGKARKIAVPGDGKPYVIQSASGSGTMIYRLRTLN